MLFGIASGAAVINDNRKRTKRVFCCLSVIIILLFGNLLQIIYGT